MGDITLESDVFKRSRPAGALISDATFNLVLGLVLCWGFLVNWIIVKQVDPAWVGGIPSWLFLVGYFGSCFYGVYLFNSSSDPAISFIGYNFVVVPFGFVVNLVVTQYDSGLVLRALQVTAAVTITMMVLGSLFPKFVKDIYQGLVVALLGMILIELAQIFIFHRVPEWTDWIVALIFCGYIGYDWGRAQNIPKTVDNAVDSAAAIYMDIINLFLRVLRILGRKK